MAVLDPLELVIENWPQGVVEWIEAVNNPEDAAAGTRTVPFSGRLWIERADFQVLPPPKYFRLFPGSSVRLRYGYIVTCTGYDTDPATGAVLRVRCSYEPSTRGGNAPDNRKVKGTIHWVSLEHAVEIEARLYDHLFIAERPMDVAPGVDWIDTVNAESLKTIPSARGEPCLASVPEGGLFQFERLGYFSADPDTTVGKPVFNRSVSLRDTWAKIERKGV